MSTTNTTNTNKMFLWKDKSGRGETANVELSDMGESDNEETSWNGEPLYDWAKEAEVGDEWENASEKYVCTSVTDQAAPADWKNNLKAISMDVEKVAELVTKISEAWNSLPVEGDEVLANKYPFDSSFDDLASDFREWSASVKANVIG